MCNLCGDTLIPLILRAVLLLIGGVEVKKEDDQGEIFEFLEPIVLEDLEAEVRESEQISYYRWNQSFQNEIANQLFNPTSCTLSNSTQPSHKGVIFCPSLLNQPKSM